MAVRTVTVDMRLNATSFLADGRAVVRLNNDMGDSFRRLTTDATAASNATENMADNVRQLGRRAAITERRVRELREEIDRLTASALAARGPINIIQGGGGGGRMAGGLFRMVTQAFMALPPQVQLAVIAAGAAIAVIFATAFGAMLAGLLVSTVELILIGGMIALAAKSSNIVQREFMGVFRPIAQEALRFGLILEGPIVKAIRIMGSAWDAMAYRVRDLFQIVERGGDIEALARGLATMVRNLLPGFEVALSSGVVRQFAQGLGTVGTALSSMLISLTRTQGAVKGIKLFFHLLSATLMGIGVVVGWLSDRFDLLTNVMEAVTGAASRIPIIGRLFEGANDFWQRFNSTGETTARTLGEAADEAGRAGAGLDRTGQAARDAEKALANLNTRMDEMVRRMTGTTDANIAYQQSIDDLTASFKENGRNIDIGTQKGRDNVTAIESVARAAFAARQAFIEQNTASMGLTAATQAANAAFKANIEALARQMRQAGLTEAQISALLTQWYAVVNAPNPNKSIHVTTYYKTVGTAVVSRNDGRSFGKLPPGTHVFNRQGGLHHARGGLMNLSGQAAMFRPGRTMYGFAEAGTGGEAFIARNADHGRSLAIANQAAMWHGGRVVTGGGYGGSTTVRVELVANPAAGSVSRAYAQIAHQAIRTGALQARVVNGRSVVGQR